MILDDNNFRMKTFTGKAPPANRTNVMFVQPESFNKPVETADIPDKRAARLSTTLKELNKKNLRADSI